MSQKPVGDAAVLRWAVPIALRDKRVQCMVQVLEIVWKWYTFAQPVHHAASKVWGLQLSTTEAGALLQY